MLELQHGSVYYGHTKVIKEVSLLIRELEIVGIIGANGSGKSTLLKAMSGLMPLSSGKLFFKGNQIEGLQAHEIVKMGISHVLEEREIFGDLSVRDNLLLGAYLRYKKKNSALIQKDMEHVIQLFPSLEPHLNSRASTLSGGEQRMLTIGMALMAKPGVLFLDEPSLGLAPFLIKNILDTVKTLRNEGVTVVLVEQNVRSTLNLADRVYVMKTGRIVKEGTKETMLADEEIVAAYLGGTK